MPVQYQGMLSQRPNSSNFANQPLQGSTSAPFNFRKDHTAIHKKENGDKEEMHQKKLMVIEGVEEGTRHLKQELIELTQKAISETVPKILAQYLPKLLREKLNPVLEELDKAFAQSK